MNRLVSRTHGARKPTLTGFVHSVGTWIITFRVPTLRYATPCWEVYTDMCFSSLCTHLFCALSYYSAAHKWTKTFQDGTLAQNAND